MKRTPGTWHDYGNNLQYVAVSRAHKVANRPAYEIAAAIEQGRLPVYEIAGAKAVTLADLLNLRAGGD